LDVSILEMWGGMVKECGNELCCLSVPGLQWQLVSVYLSPLILKHVMHTVPYNIANCYYEYIISDCWFS